jgi:hypothetical protein
MHNSTNYLKHAILVHIFNKGSIFVGISGYLILSTRFCLNLLNIQDVTLPIGHFGKDVTLHIRIHIYRV